MIEDKLKASERIRLEAIAQANMTLAGRSTPDGVLKTAERYEKFIITGEGVPK